MNAARPGAGGPGAGGGVAGRLPAVPSSRLPAGRRAADVALAASGWVWLALVAAGAPVALRGIATFGFAAFVPGLALRAWIPASDRLERFVYSLAASLSVCVIITLVLALAHTLTAELTIACLAALTTLAATADLAGTLGQPPAP